MILDHELRARRQELFALERTTGKKHVPIVFDRGPVPVYANANFSIYSGQRCNARCPFCVEELRPLSRGRTLESQRRTIPEADYFARLERALEVVRPLDPSVSITGGEASIDPRLPGILRRVASAGARQRVLTTNGSGLLERRPEGRVVDLIVDAGFHHLNVSRASSDEDVNQAIMRIGSGSTRNAHVAEAVRVAQQGGVRVRFSCVLLRGVTETIEDVIAYVRWARSLGVTRTIFRQLMKHDPRTVLEGPVTRYSDERRVDLFRLLDALPSGFRLVRQILGYYYYVEVYDFEGATVVFEGADLAEIREHAAREPGVVHELIFHPTGTLNATWQPWDGVLLA